MAAEPVPPSVAETVATPPVAPPAKPRRRRPTDPLGLLELRSFARVAVLATGASDRVVGATLAALHDRTAELHVWAAEAEPAWALERFDARFRRVADVWEVNWLLKQIGPVDAVVDLTDDASMLQARTWEVTFCHLRDRGVYVAVGGRRQESSRSLRDRLSRVLAAPAPSRLEQAVETVFADDAGVGLVKRGHHALKLRDWEVDRFLPTRDVPCEVEVFARRPAGVLTSRSTITHHGVLPAESEVTLPNAFDTELPYPQVTLRHYTGELTLASHSLLHTEATILPETFRYPLAKIQEHGHLDDVTGQFARVQDQGLATTTLTGNYFHLDSPFPGHFGHVSTEVVSRLWGWDEAKRRIPDLKALWRIRHPNERDPSFERAFFTAYGIAPQDQVWVDHPVRLQSLVAVTPMWQNHSPCYTHPDLAGVWQRLGDGLVTASSVEASAPEPARRIFVARPGGLARHCRNADAVQDFFVRHGFTVVQPETLTLAEQAQVFRGARVVAGLAGSAMFNIMFCAGLEQLIVLTHNSYTARNEHQFAAVLGGRVDYFWSAADVGHAGGEYSQEAFTSDWEFDFDANRADLEVVLAGLDPSP